MNATAELPAPELIEFNPRAPIAEYSPNDAAIDLLKHEHAEVLANLDAAATPEGYKHVAKVLRAAVGARNAIDRRRLDCGTDAREWIARVNKEGHRLIERVTNEIEAPLRAAKAKVDDEAARIVREAEEKVIAERRAIEQAEHDRLTAEREAAIAANRAEAERLRDEHAKLEQERQVERERMAEERAKYQAEVDAERKAYEEQSRIAKQEERETRERVAAEHRAAQAKIDAERKLIDDERERLNRIKFEQEERERAEQRAAERVKRQAEDAARAKVEGERVAKAEADELAAEAQRINASLPDLEKIRQFGEAIRVLATDPRSALTTEPARLFAVAIRDELMALAGRCKAYAVATRRTPRKATVAP